MVWPSSTKMVPSKQVVPTARLRAEGSKPSAKQKTFGAGFATALSPASYLAPKKPHVFLGGFSGAGIKSGRGEVESGGIFHTPLKIQIAAEDDRLQIRKIWLCHWAPF